MSLARSRDPIKVAFVITGLGIGGAETMLLKLVEHSAVFRAGQVIALRSGGELEDRFRAMNVPVLSLGMKKGVPDPRAIVRLACHFRRERPDVVSTWMHHADLIGGFSARVIGVPVVWGLHSSNLSGQGTSASTMTVVRTNSLLSRWIPDVIMCCSHRAQKDHEALGYPARKFKIVPNGFDVDRFRPDTSARTILREELQVSGDAQLVGLVARVDPLKNHLGFIVAAGHVARSLPNAHFVLVGGGATTHNEELAGWIRGQRLQNRFHLLGLRADMPRIMAALDVAVLSSRVEAFPLVLGEAMACGVPCVTTDVGDAALIVGDSGIVVAAGDMVALAEGIVRILTMNSSVRDSHSARARARIVGHFEINSVARRYEEIFRATADCKA